MNRKKKIEGLPFYKSRIFLIVLAAVVVLCGVGILCLRLAGYRRFSVKYLNTLDATEETLSFTGFLHQDGTVKKGRIFSDTGSAEVVYNGDGTYTMTYSNGDLYVGELDGLQRQGQGKMTYTTGDVYEGGFQNDKFHGEGTFTYAGGDSYTGSFSGGKKSGYGRYVWSAENGKGASYEGEFRNDRRNGYGVYTEPDGTVYAGNFVNDLREDDNASVCIVTAEGKIDRYYGGFENDVRSGFGYYFYANGDVYVGQFSNNNIHGTGTIYRLSGGSYTGEFEWGNIKKNQATPVPEEEAAEILSLDPTVNPLN